MVARWWTKATNQRLKVRFLYPLQNNNEMSKFIWDHNGDCTNSDGMYYKADNILVSYQVAKNKHGWKHSYTIHGSNVTICAPINWNDQDVSENQRQAVDLAKFELIQALTTANYNGRFDGVLMAIGEIPIVKPQISIQPQLTLF